jgi:hypothetical protein
MNATVAITAVAVRGSDKRYTRQRATALLRRLTTVARLDVYRSTVNRARPIFAELLSARLSDVVVQNPERLVSEFPDSAIPVTCRAVFHTLSIALNEDGKWPEISLNVKLTTSGPQSLRLEVTGTFIKMLALQLYSLLRIAGDRLRQCECGQLYVKVKGQKYCSTRCQKRFYMRQFRAGEVGSLE